MKQRMETRISAIVLSAVLLFLAPGFVLTTQQAAEAAPPGTYDFWQRTDVDIEQDFTFTGSSVITVSTYDSTNINFISNIEAIGQSTSGSTAVAWEKSTGSITGNLYAEGLGKARALLIEHADSDLKYVGDIMAKGNVEAYGVEILDGGNILSTTGSVVVSGDTAYGFNVKGDSDVTHEGSVAAFGNNATAVYLNGATMTITGSLLASEDETLIGSSTPNGQFALDIHAGATATVTGELTALGSKATGAHVDNSTLDMAGNVLAEGDGAIGVEASNTGDVTITGKVTAIGTNATAIKSDNSVITINDGTVSVSGTDSILMQLTQGTVNLNNVTATADSLGVLLSTENGGTLTATASNLSGNIINDNNAVTGDTLDITLDGNSALTGAISDTGSEAVTNLTVADSGSVWYVTEDSQLNGALENYGAVSFTNASAFTTLTVADLTDSGSADTGAFIMRADVVNQESDQLEVTGTMNGAQYNITVLNDTSALTNGNEVSQLVDVADTTGVFQLTNNVEQGGWQYGLRQTDGGLGSVWELYGLNEISSTWDAAANTFRAGYLLAYAETQTLMQRMGDLRETSYLSGFWFKGHGGKFDADAGNNTRSFDMDYWGVQLGYDRRVETDWDGELYTGIMFGYSKGDLDYAGGGSGNVDSKTLGVYGTFVQPNGFFVDLVLKYQWMDNDFNTIDTAGMRVNGDDVSNNGFGASIEVGKRISFENQKDGNGRWYVEPQAQLSWQNFDGGYFNASNGLRVSADSYTSLMGRLGMLVGFETPTSNFYAKVSLVKEFDGDMTFYANSSKITESFSDNWWVYGLGYTSKINDRNSLYIDLERASGGAFEQKWALKASWRVLF